ncbi:hypothetical protein [Methylopila turkensis]|uniref:Uncharacterized protein n=1 Tax=Methylopila turkensis TaxID=1437816 RepID=A0A9W6JN52_9HYPH|nr:hypothetical protein [Methylopila turkensis]GLK80152.1 hypothetical protein GCM10008174_18930 [Methylopila turkensis]
MAERKRYDEPEMIREPGVEPDQRDGQELDLMASDDIDDGATGSEDSGAGSFLDRFVPPRSSGG